MRKKVFYILIFVIFIILIYLISSQEYTKDKIKLESGPNVSFENHETDLKSESMPAKKLIEKKVVSLALKDLLSKINNHEKLTPEILSVSLKDIFHSFPEKQHLSLTLKMVPLLMYLDKNYKEYREVIGELYADVTNPALLRLPMLQIMGQHFADKEKVLIEEVFSRQESKSEWLIGESALVLAKNNIDISKEMMNRYDFIGETEKSFYAKSLSLLDTKEALSMIKESIPQMQNVKAKSSLLHSYAKLSSDSDDAPYAIDTLLSIANNVDIKKKNTVPDEIYSIQAVMALGSMKSDEAYMSLLIVAQKEDALPSTRIAALESLTLAGSDFIGLMQDEFKQLILDVKNTQLIDTIDKQRIQKRIQPLLNKK